MAQIGTTLDRYRYKGELCHAIWAEANHLAVCTVRQQWNVIQILLYVDAFALVIGGGSTSFKSTKLKLNALRQTLLLVV